MPWASSRSLWEQVANASPTVDDLHEAAALLIASGGQDPGQRLDEDVGHLLGSHLLGRMENEAACSGPFDRLLLARLPPDPLVLREDDPPLPARFLEPHLIIGVLREEVVVSDDVRVHFPQTVGNLSSTEASVDEEIRRRGARGTALRL